MYEAVRSTLQKNESKWETIPVFVDLVLNFYTKVEEINELANTRSANKKWITEQKNALFTEVSNRTFALIGVLRTYAKVIQNTEMEREFTQRKGEFVSGNAKLRLNRINGVIAKVEAMSTELVDFGLSPELIDEVIDKRNQLTALLFEPRNIVVERKKKGKLIASLTREIDDIVHTQLFSLIRLMEKEQPAFAIEYAVSKTLVDLRGKRQTRNTPDAPPTPGLYDSD
jgi:hypothetical protein